MTTIKIDETKLLSTIALIENHLDGAVSDYELGWVDNVDFLLDMIYVHKTLLSASTGGWSDISPNEYEERIKIASQKRKEQ